MKPAGPFRSSHLGVSAPSHQRDQVTSWKAILVGRAGRACSAGVHPRGQVSKVPGHGYRGDGGGGGETDAAVDVLQRKRPQKDGKVHLEHVVSQRPTAFLRRADTKGEQGSIHGAKLLERDSCGAFRAAVVHSWEQTDAASCLLRCWSGTSPTSKHCDLEKRNDRAKKTNTPFACSEKVGTCLVSKVKICFARKSITGEVEA